MAKQVPLWKAVAEYIRAMGMPFIWAGDLNAHPDCVRRSGLLELLDAEVFAPNEPTCTMSGSIVDYFIVSRCFAPQVREVRVLHGSRLTPHHPVRLSIDMNTRPSTSTVLPRPRPLPVERPIGPTFLGAWIKWDDWREEYTGRGVDGCTHDQGGEIDGQRLDDAIKTWYAGAEAELNSKFGVFGAPHEHEYLGLGSFQEPVGRIDRGRYRDTPIELGLLGHRLAWTARALSTAIRYSGWLIKGDLEKHPNDKRAKLALQLRRLGHRAEAYRLERPARNDERRPEEHESWANLRIALAHLAEMALRRHRKPPLVESWLQGRGGEAVDRLRQQEEVILSTTDTIAKRRRRKEQDATKQWAKQAPIAVAHKATKTPSGAIGFTASARKDHLGETSAQKAADKGLSEWGPTWEADDRDAAHEILQALEATEYVQRHPTIELPTIDEHRVGKISCNFRGSTGVGRDWLRLRHIIMLSRDARSALAQMLRSVEAVRRWPNILREVLAVALGKKEGGCRLIGLATGIYRLWAKLRFFDCRGALEKRLHRPFLTAAPGMCALEGAFQDAWKGELAAAKGMDACGIMVDMKSYYEHIEVKEYAMTALEFGVPPAIVMLTSHLYLGPRRIRVRNAVSARAYPKRSVLPGCTWATVHVRFHVIKPAEQLVHILEHRLAPWASTSAYRFTLTTPG